MPRTCLFDKVKKKLFSPCCYFFSLEQDFFFTARNRFLLQEKNLAARKKKSLFHENIFLTSEIISVGVLMKIEGSFFAGIR